MWFFSKAKNKIKSNIKETCNGFMQFCRLLAPYGKKENQSEMITTGIAFVGMQVGQVVSMILLTNAQKNQENTHSTIVNGYNTTEWNNSTQNFNDSPQAPAYYLSLISGLVQVLYFSTQYTLSQKLKFSLENSLKHDLFQKQSENKMAIGLDFVTANEPDQTPLPEISSRHIKQFSEGAIVMTFESLSTILCIFTTLYGASRLSNTKMMSVSSAMAVGVAAACHLILNGKINIEEKNQEIESKTSTEFSVACQKKAAIVALGGESSEYGRMMNHIQEKNTFKNKRGGLDAGLMMILGSAFFAFPIILKTLAPILDDNDRPTNPARLDMFSLQMVMVMAYLKDLLMARGKDIPQMFLSMKTLAELQNNMAQWLEFHKNNNPLSMNFESKTLGFSAIRMAIPVANPVVFLIGTPTLPNTTAIQNYIKDKVFECIGSNISKDIVLVKNTHDSYYIVHGEVQSEQFIAQRISKNSLDQRLGKENMDKLTFSTELSPLTDLIETVDPEDDKAVKEYTTVLVDLQEKVINLARETYPSQAKDFISHTVDMKDDDYVSLNDEPSFNEYSRTEKQRKLKAQEKSPTDSFSKKVNQVLVKDGRLILDSADLSLIPGKVYKLCGASGDGKSTIIKMVAGMFPYAKGTLHFPWAETEHTQKLAYSPQLPFIPTECTLLEAIAYPVPLKKIKKDFSDRGFVYEDQVKYFMRCLGLTLIPSLRIKKDNWDILSGGETQRVSVLRILLKHINPPALIMLDEYTASIDRESKMVIEYLLKKYLPNTTILFVDHQPLTAGEIVDNDPTIKRTAFRTECINNIGKNFQFADYHLNIKDKKMHVTDVTKPKSEYGSGFTPIFSTATLMTTSRSTSISSEADHDQAGYGLSDGDSLYEVDEKTASNRFSR